MRWELTGADEKTGREITMTVEAPSREEAERSANYNGVLVTAAREVLPDGARRPAADEPKRPVVEYQAPAAAPPPAPPRRQRGLIPWPDTSGGRPADEPTRAAWWLRTFAWIAFRVGLVAVVSLPVILLGNAQRDASASSNEASKRLYGESHGRTSLQDWKGEELVEALERRAARTWWDDAAWGTFRFGFWSLIASAFLRASAVRMDSARG